MKTITVFLASVLMLGAARAQSPNADGGTHLVLGITYSGRLVLPSRVSVPAGEKLTVTGPSFGSRPVQWLKNYQAIPGATINPLVISAVTASDAGTYVLVEKEPAVFSLPSQSLVLSVGPSERIANLSTRGWVGGADQAFVAGFVVTTSGATASKKIIVRAVGPSLAPFGVTNVLKQPVLKLYDSAGRLYTNSYGYSGIVGGLTPETDFANSLASVGAFPIPAGTKDVTELRPFTAGSYTAHVTSADGSTGNVLLEVYEVP